MDMSNRPQEYIPLSRAVLISFIERMNAEAGKPMVIVLVGEPVAISERWIEVAALQAKVADAERIVPPSRPHWDRRSRWGKPWR